MFKIPSDQYAALRRAVIDIIYILSEFCGDLDEDTLSCFLNYVVEGFKSKSTFDVSSQCFERLIEKNLSRFATSLDNFLDHLTTFASYIDHYSGIQAKCFTTVLYLAITVLGNSPKEFQESFQKCISPFVEILENSENAPDPK